MVHAGQFVPVIGIIGGADGPTTIYVSDGYFFQIAAILFAVLFFLAVLGFIRSIKKRKRIRAIVYGAIIAAFVFLAVAVTVLVTRQSF